MTSQPDLILCPLCPLCRRRPVDFYLNISPWFCGNDDCLVLCWDPYITRQANLLNSSPMETVEGVPEE